jgi:hypothetical protein
LTTNNHQNLDEPKTRVNDSEKGDMKLKENKMTNDMNWSTPDQQGGKE